MIPILTANTVSDQPPQLQLWLQGRACRDHSLLEPALAGRAFAPLVELVETTEPLIEPAPAGQAPPPLVEPVETTRPPEFYIGAALLLSFSSRRATQFDDMPADFGGHGRVAEWQTRWLQVPVSFGTWGFKSPFAHREQFYRDSHQRSQSLPDCDLCFLSGALSLLRRGLGLWGLVMLCPHRGFVLHVNNLGFGFAVRARRGARIADADKEQTTRSRPTDVATTFRAHRGSSAYWVTHRQKTRKATRPVEISPDASTRVDHLAKSGCRDFAKIFDTPLVTVSTPVIASSQGAKSAHMVIAHLVAAVRFVSCCTRVV